MATRSDRHDLLRPPAAPDSLHHRLPGSLVAVAPRLATILLPALAACTIVEIHSDPEAVRVERGFGFVTVDAGAPTQTTLIRVRGVGLVRTPLASTLGYAAHDLAVADGSCEVVVWVTRPQHIPALHQLTRDLNGVCPVHFDQGFDHDIEE